MVSYTNSVTLPAQPLTIVTDSMFSLPVLEHQLAMYVSSDSRDTFQDAFDISKVPTVSREQADAEDLTKKTASTTPTIKAPSAGPKASAKSGADAAASASAAAQKYSEELSRIPEMAAYGGVLKSSAPFPLTEPETEFVVSAIKHIFKDHIVLQYDVKNTLPDTVLLDVQMVVTPTEDEDVQVEEEFIIPAPKVSTDESGTVYVSFKRLETESQYIATSFQNVLKFTSKEIDPSTNEPEEGDGYDDEYQIEDLDLTGADYVVPAYAGSFDNVWEQASGDEATETMQLGNIKSIAGESSPFPLPSSPLHDTVEFLFEMEMILTPQSQMQPNSSSRHSPCSPSRAPTLRSRRRRTRSSCTARRSRAGRWRCWYAWRIARRRA